MAQKVFPTKSNLINTKKTLALTKTGWEFLDKKRNILVREMMMTIQKAQNVQNDVASKFAEGYDLMQKATISLGMFNQFSFPIPIDNSIEMDYRSIMGVEIPTLTIEQSELKPYYGLNFTSSDLDKVYLKFNEIKTLIVKLAEIESSVYRLADAIKKTQKRANALENILIPQFEQTIRYISEELDEKEREDFSRLKVVKGRRDRE
ncbi:V-type sodium ATPase subunit D [bioreactor metagenome]|uniref:V-type sodium ATPase subunit D n=1 Tax=bioreactor metagenome TaxID=1076179 RepID=A0A645ERA9_9ZZZZ